MVFVIRTGVMAIVAIIPFQDRDVPAQMEITSDRAAHPQGSLFSHGSPTDSLVAQVTKRRIAFIIGFKSKMTKAEIAEVIRPMQLVSVKIASRKRNIYGVVVRTEMTRSRAMQFMKDKAKTYLVEFDSTVKP